MKFTIETEPFQRMLEMLAQARPVRKRRFVPLRLEASRGRLRAQQGDLTAEIEALVWEDGRCAVSADRLGEAVKASRAKPSLVIGLQDDRLRVGDSPVPCIADCPPVRWQAASRIFFASDLGVVASPQSALSAA